MPVTLSHFMNIFRSIFLRTGKIVSFDGVDGVCVGSAFPCRLISYRNAEST